MPLRTRYGQRGVLFIAALDDIVDEIVGGQRRFDVRVVSYRYRLLDEHARVILAFGWHPVGESHVTVPHLHLSSRVGPIELGRGREGVALAEMQNPTGPVRFADAVRLLIAEFGVAPRRGDWASVLAAED